MVIIPPCCYVEVANPVMLQDGQPLYDKNQQVRLQLGESEIRF